jgi:phage host-nuclease inhibitor protein Gam
MPAKKSRAKRQAPQVPVPQTAAEADDFIRLIGTCQRQLALIQAAQDEQIALIRARTAEEAAAYENEIRERTEGLQVWCEANRAALTQNGKVKSAQFAGGEVSWRLRPPSVALKDVKAVIDAIRSLQLFQFLRTTVTVDKEAMLKEPEKAGAIPGVSIGSTGEDFIVTPIEEPVTPAPVIPAPLPAGAAA